MAKSTKVVYKNSEGEDKAVIIKKPSHTQLTEANLHSASIFNKARQAGACLRSQVDDWLEDSGVWTKEHRAEIRKLEQLLADKLKVLETGKNAEGKKLKLSEARKLAVEIRVDRWRLNLLQIQKRSYDEYTVEGQAENARFDYLTSVCLLDEEGNKLFNSIDEYYENAELPHIAEAAARLAGLIFGTEDWEKNLPENQFLVKHNLVDDKGRLVNKDGQFVDADGKVIEADNIEEVSEDTEPLFEDDLS